MQNRFRHVRLEEAVVPVLAKHVEDEFEFNPKSKDDWKLQKAMIFWFGYLDRMKAARRAMSDVAVGNFRAKKYLNNEMADSLFSMT